MEELCLDIIHETEMAYLLDDGDIREWVPKSLLEWEGHSPKPGDTVVFKMPENIAEEKGFV